MTKFFLQLITKGCLATLFIMPVLALYCLFDIAFFTNLTKSNLKLPIQWETVSSMQWYSLWGMTFLYVVVGLVGLYYLSRAFSQFAKGELFNLNNSRNLRMSSIFLFAQALAKPLYIAVASLMLSMHHPAGQKFVSISFGSGEFIIIALAMILWVISDLLVKANSLENENKQFI